jgi:hypothetical protein
VRRDSDPALAARLGHVYWIGGGSGAGKSTMARRLAGEHGLRLYATDDVMADHGERSTPQSAPLLAEFAAMDMDERWVDRTPQTMLETFHWYRGEGFDLIVEDLLAFPPRPEIVVEGFRLLPRLVNPLLDRPGRAVWLIPTPEFRLAAFNSRRSMWTIAGQTSDSGRALGNLLERDRMFTERLAIEARELGLPTIEIDRSMSEDDLAERVTDVFGLAGDHTP